MDDIKKMYLDSMKAIMKDSFTEKEIEAYAQFMADKTKTVKRGEDVIHLNYYRGLISDYDLSIFQSKLEEVNLQFSSYDETGVATNSLQDFIDHFVLIITPALIDNIIFGIAGNAAWDAIRQIVKTVWLKTRNQKINYMSGSTAKEKDITFGIKASLNAETKYDFRIDGNLSEETALIALDKILDFLKQQKIETKYTGYHFSRFNPETKEWTVIDMLEEVRKIHSKQQDKKDSK